MAVARSSSDDNAISYVLPVLNMTSCLPVMGYVARGLRGRGVIVTHQGAHPGAKSLKMICNDFLVVKVNCWSYVFNIMK